MKLLILFLAFATFSLNVFAQKITLEDTNYRLSEVTCSKGYLLTEDQSTSTTIEESSCEAELTVPKAAACKAEVFGKVTKLDPTLSLSLTPTRVAKLGALVVRQNGVLLGRQSVVGHLVEGTDMWLVEMVPEFNQDFWVFNGVVFGRSWNAMYAVKAKYENASDETMEVYFEKCNARW